MQNIILLIEPYKEACEISFKSGNMCLNRFCIDEDAGNEISGIYYLKEASDKITDYKYDSNKDSDIERLIKGKEGPI